MYIIIIIGPNVPILGFRVDFLLVHLEPWFPGAQHSPNGALLVGVALGYFHYLDTIIINHLLPRGSPYGVLVARGILEL